ncbi:hypothetical protein RVR_8056 [Actinacidiphila reveromycinica]|uniref:Uncharacterized protein n=1 Tax=Actinacidiphila reveromycinica TaxID=659352 RepID=A0A7U3UYE2_9ACTN|nr:hypothetical protein [Streptomyces sp. SN-593]BBB00877.1 hypothetical protein RVR_8056 [Streptomyces sp. SN-593]
METADNEAIRNRAKRRLGPPAPRRSSPTPTPTSTTSATEPDDANMRFLPAADAISMLFKETAHGGLAVNVIEC